MRTEPGKLTAREILIDLETAPQDYGVTPEHVKKINKLIDNAQAEAANAERRREKYQARAENTQGDE